MTAAGAGARDQERNATRLPVVCLAGPTASGKTDLAMALADRFPCALISVDSSLVYRGMDIGTAKPSRALLRRYPHALIDIRNPDETYSAGDFARDATAAIAAAHQARRLPVLVGGTLLYFRALLGGLSALPAADQQFRQHLQARAEKIGWRALHGELSRVDPLAARGIDAADRQRISRALEVFTLTGRPLSSHWSVGATVTQPPWRVHWVKLYPAERAWLHQRIALRTAAMLRQGLIDEVAHLVERYPQASALRAVGYRQVAEWLARGGGRSTPSLAGVGINNVNEVDELITIATRQLARRQLTWMRGDPQGFWWDPATSDKARVVDVMARWLGAEADKVQKAVSTGVTHSPASV